MWFLIYEERPNGSQFGTPFELKKKSLRVSSMQDDLIAESIAMRELEKIRQAGVVEIQEPCLVWHERQLNF